jgi:hypothetical protein
MSGACSPGGETTQAAVEVSPEGRDLLQKAQAMLGDGRIDEARVALGNLQDPALVRDWRVNRVREVLSGEPTPTALSEATDLLSRTIQDIR